MSGPNVENLINLAPHEVRNLLEAYRAHVRPLDEECGCGADNCRVGASARNRLWAAGINPEKQP